MARKLSTWEFDVLKPPNLGFAFYDIAVRAGVFQRDLGLRGEQFRHRDPGRREDVRGQVVFQVRHVDELSLVDQRQAVNRMRMVLMEVGLRGTQSVALPNAPGPSMAINRLISGLPVISRQWRGAKGYI